MDGASEVTEDSPMNTISYKEQHTRWPLMRSTVRQIAVSAIRCMHTDRDMLRT